MQIGMELHDNVKQIIAASLIRLDMAGQNINDNEKAAKALEKAKEYIREAISEIRHLSHQLAPSIHSDETLKEKIEKLLTKVNSNSLLQVGLNVLDFNTPVRNDIQLALYRILQAQLDNILTHANAHSVVINIQPVNDNLQFTIKDDGQGTDSTAKNDGIGLENIKRRVHALDGQVKIFSSAGNGCEINIVIPLNNNIGI